MTTPTAAAVDPDTGIPDLVRRLADDSKRLARDEVRLAKLEMHESIHTAGQGAIWLGIAFGAGVLTASAVTIALVVVVGRLLGHYWAGALVVGAIELVVALVLVRRGIGRVRNPSYTFDASRDALRDTVDWARTARAH